MWADSYWVVSHSKAHLEQMLKDPIQEAERWDFEPKPATLWWTSTYTSEEKKDVRRHRIPFGEHFKTLGFSMNREGQTRLLGRKDAKSKQSLVGRREDLQKQRRAVEGEVQKDDGICLLRLLLWKRKLVLESCHSGQN